MILAPDGSEPCSVCECVCVSAATLHHQGHGTDRGLANARRRGHRGPAALADEEAGRQRRRASADREGGTAWVRSVCVCVCLSTCMDNHGTWL